MGGTFKGKLAYLTLKSICLLFNFSKKIDEILATDCCTPNSFFYIDKDWGIEDRLGSFRVKNYSPKVRLQIP